MMRTGYLLPILLLLFVFISGCPSETKAPLIAPVSQQSSNPEAESLFKEGVALFDDAALDEADEKFSLFLTRFGDDPLVSQVYLYRGRIAWKQDRLTAANDFFRKVYDRGESEPLYEYAAMYLGLMSHDRAEYKEAVAFLLPVAGRFSDGEENLNVLKTVWRSYAALNDWKQEIVWIDAYLNAQPGEDERQAALSEVQKLIVQMSIEDLADAQKTLNPKEMVWAIVSAQIARVQFENGQFAEADKTVTEIQQANEKNAVLLSDLIELIERRNRVDIRTVGCLLPLSGKMRLVGQDVLKGVMLASRQNRFGREASPLTIVMRDTGGGDVSPEKMVEELVMNHKVSAIVGPMDAHIAKRAVLRAQQLGVPIIVLSADETLTSVGNFVFRKFASNLKEVDALLNAAEETSRMSDEYGSTLQYASLFPENGYGKLMNTLLQQQLDARGLSAVTISFDPETRDFGKLAKTLAQKEFNVLFLPMTSAQLALAAPALAAADIWPASPDETREDVRVATYLVPSVGYSPSLVSRSGRYLQGAKFALDFFVAGPSSIQNFIRNFQNEYKTSPSPFAGYGYDATMLVSNAINSGVTTRSELRTWLAETASSPRLVYPFAGFDETGESIALPAVYSLTGSDLQDLQEQ
ncbi:MAG: ABC transporter substrate-binding protein [Deltaproteobacteria bacterium]|nr:ABC transporter substrate-binding protein [Deltaproteobacteria bacterium]